MVNSIKAILLFTIIISTLSCSSNNNSLYPNDVINFSQQFVLAIKSGEPYEKYNDTLARINLEHLAEDLNSSDKKLAFWINTYNALVQVKLKQDNSSFNNQDAFFNTNDIVIGGEKLSLNQIENGILRKKSVQSNQDFISTFAVDQLDFRIHFTLNCGALSCPPIAFYSASNLNNELNLAEESFVTGNSTYNLDNNTLEISELFNWFREDFGGDQHIIQLMKKYDILEANASPKITFSKYDWSLTTDNY